MFHIYFDESKYQKANFVIGAFVFCKEDPAEFVSQTLLEYGFDQPDDEYKSGFFFERNHGMVKVRQKLKDYFNRNVLFGALVLPHTELRHLGSEALKALKQFLTENEMGIGNKVYFDEGIFESCHKAMIEIKALGLEQNEFHLEQNSKAVKGIQIADLCSHCLTTMLRESMGDLRKTVTIPEYPGYDSKDVDIGYQIWASIRYSFLADRKKQYIDRASQLINRTYNVEPFGLFISDYCSDELTAIARGRFGTVYLGCIH